MKHSLSRSLLVAAGGILFATAAVAQTHPLNVPGPKPVVKPQAVAPQVAPDNGLGMALLGAQVSGTGNVNFGAGATGAIRLGAGTYEVQFNRDVTQCIYSASPFGDNHIATAVEPRSGNPNGVFLIIRAIATPSTVVDDIFYLTVFCNK